MSADKQSTQRKKDAEIDKKQNYISIAMSVLLLNLRRIEKLRAEILALLFRSFKFAFIQ